MLKSIQDSSYSLQYFSLLIALLAVFFGPIMSFFAAKLTLRSQIAVAERTIRSQVLSVNRQQWINTLRDTISEYVSLLWVSSAGFLDDQNSYPEMQRVTQVKTKLSLLLNPTEEDHKQLDQLLTKAMVQVAQESQKTQVSKEFIDIHDEITRLSQRILKREWERVKTLE